VGHGGDGPEVVASLFRCFHSIKGNAAMAGRVEVSKFAHRIESVLDVVRESGRALADAEARQLIEAVDLLHPLIEGGAAGELEPLRAQLDNCLAALERATLGAKSPSVPALATAMGLGGGRPDDATSSESGTDGGPTGAAKLRIDAQSIVDSMKVAGELFQIDERLKFFVHQGISAPPQDSQEAAERWGGLTQLSREFDAAIEKLYEQLIDI